MIGHADDVKASPTEKIDKLFAGQKSQWRKAYDTLEAKVRKFGADVEIAPNMTYINLVRGAKKFGIVQVAVERLDIGIKLKGAAPTDRFEAAGAWNAMVTHRVRITDPKADRQRSAGLVEAGLRSSGLIESRSLGRTHVYSNSNRAFHQRALHVAR